MLFFAQLITLTIQKPRGSLLLRNCLLMTTVQRSWRDFVRRDRVTGSGSTSWAGENTTAIIQSSRDWWPPFNTLKTQCDKTQLWQGVKEYSRGDRACYAQGFAQDPSFWDAVQWGYRLVTRDDPTLLNYHGTDIRGTLFKALLHSCFLSR